MFWLLAFTLQWYQAPPTPPVTAYTLTVNQTPGAAAWPAAAVTPAGTNVWKRDIDLAPGDTVQLQSCNDPGCSDLSNVKIVPTYTSTQTPTLTRTHTPTATITPSRTAVGQTPRAPLLWDVH